MYLSTLLLLGLLKTVSSACNEKFIIKSGEGMEVTSPNYPADFKRNIHCFYDFTTHFASGDVIHILVLDVTLSCDDESTSLEVFDAFSTSPRYLGRVCKTGPSLFVSPKERLYLIFKSEGNSSDRSRGFKLRVEAVPEFNHCYGRQAKVIHALPEPQQIISPYYPYEVAPNVHCRWLFKAPPGQRVKLALVDANMKGSNDCYNFGLYVFDGKTTYDDERLGKVCDNDIQSFHSTGNYLLVVFSSGPHVLHSGGGVKMNIQLYPADPSANKRDHTLLYVLIGVLVAVASFTLLMIILRYLVLPARRQALLRRYNLTNRGLFNRTSGLMSMRYLPTDPPPPYRATAASTHESMGSKVFGAICGCCFKIGKEPRHSDSRGESRTPANPLAVSVISEDHLTPAVAGTSNLNPASLAAFLEMLNPSTIFSEVLNNFQRGEITTGETVPVSLFNEYQELPGVSSCLRVTSGRDGVTFSANDGLNENGDNIVDPSEYNGVVYSVDSGYVGDMNKDVEAAGLSGETLDNSSNLKTNTDLDGFVNDDIHDNISSIVDDEHSEDDTESINRYVFGDDNASTNNDTDKWVNVYVDEDGYEIPQALHHYDTIESVTGQNANEEVIYQSLQFDIEIS